MSTIIKWVIPCYFNEKQASHQDIEFDLTNHLQLFLKNEVWNRKFDYGFSNGLKNTDLANIKSASARIFPRFTSGNLNENRIIEYVEKHCQKFAPYLKIDNYRTWNHNLGVVIIEVEYHNLSKEIPSKKDVIQIKYQEDFYRNYHKHVAILKELASFFFGWLTFEFSNKIYNGME